MLDLLRISLDANGTVSAAANIWIAVALMGLAVIFSWLLPWLRDLLFRQEYAISEIELGIGAGSVKLAPNHDDLQIAYKLWVELKTRKLGLPFDEEHDVIIEVYNSWHEFFRITRELIKTVPVAKIRGQRSTQLLVGISIDVLNKAIRPHLTKWQARFRHWHEVELKNSSQQSISPQELQKKFPEYTQLISELKVTNVRLVAYAKTLTDLLEVNPVKRGARKG